MMKSKALLLLLIVSGISSSALAMIPTPKKKRRLNSTETRTPGSTRSLMSELNKSPLERLLKNYERKPIRDLTSKMEIFENQIKLYEDNPTFEPEITALQEQINLLEYAIDKKLYASKPLDLIVPELIEKKRKFQFLNSFLPECKPGNDHRKIAAMIGLLQEEVRLLEDARDTRQEARARGCA